MTEESLEAITLMFEVFDAIMIIINIKLYFQFSVNPI
jgi:hypothetical protein